MNRRLNKIYLQLENRGLDALLVSLPANIHYLTDYPSRDSYLFLSKKEKIYFTDSRYTEEAKKLLGSRFPVQKINGQALHYIAHTLNGLGAKNVGFEDKHLSFAEYKGIKDKLNPKVNFIPTRNLVEVLRQIKDAGELKKIRLATDITVKALDFIKDLIMPGRREIEIVGDLQRFIRYAGGLNAGFDIIVASGPNSSFPHHISSYRKIEKNEPVLIDIGVDYLGYKSDLTRVFFSGKITSLCKKVYDIAREAQQKAINTIKPAVKISRVDTAARQYIKRKGYGGLFNHNLGHGIGLEVHEAPNISSKNTGELKKGMVFTVEPGIYLPGKFGIRIEDTVLVTSKRVEVISGALDK